MELTVEEVIDGIIALFSIFSFVMFTLMVLNLPQITNFLERMCIVWN